MIKKTYRQFLETNYLWSSFVHDLFSHVPISLNLRDKPQTNSKLGPYRLSWANVEFYFLSKRILATQILQFGYLTALYSFVGLDEAPDCCIGTCLGLRKKVWERVDMVDHIRPVQRDFSIGKMRKQKGRKKDSNSYMIQYEELILIKGKSNYT